MQIDQPIGAFCSDSEWMLHKPFRIHTRLGKILILPGFKSDGASIPRFLWSLVGPRFAPNTFPAALVHDALYATQLCQRKEADAVFRDILYALRQFEETRFRWKWVAVLVNILDAIFLGILPWVYWAAVRICGGFIQRKSDPHKIAEACKKVIIFIHSRETLSNQTGRNAE